MFKNKEWWKSKTIWAAVFNVVVVTASVYFGANAPTVIALIGVGSAFGIYGRVNAIERLK